MPLSGGSMTINKSIRLGFRITSLALGFLIWAYLSGGKQAKIVTKAYTIPVYFENIAEDAMLMENIFYEVNIQLRGPEQLVRRINPDELYLSINLQDKNYGVHSIPLTEQMVHKPKDVQLVSITPNAIQFRVERKVSKPVAVRPVIVGQPADGFEVHQTIVTPPAIQIEGPVSAFQDYDHVETEPIDVTGLNSSFSTQTFVLLKSQFLKILKESTVKVDVIIGEETKTRIMRGLPVDLMNRTSKTWVNPDRINVVVTGPISYLEQLSRNQLKVEVDCNDLPARAEDYVLSPTIRISGENSDILNRNLELKTSPEMVHVRVF